MRDFHQYKVWSRGHQFALSIYKKTKGFPKEELLLAFDLEFLDKESYQPLDKEVKEIKAMLSKLIDSIN